MTSALYRRTLESARWRSLKWVRICLAGFRCEGCGWQWSGRTPRQAMWFFDLHHVNYYRVGEEQIDDVRVLCRDCHSATHGITT